MNKTAFLDLWARVKVRNFLKSHEPFLFIIFWTKLCCTRHAILHTTCQTGFPSAHMFCTCSSVEQSSLIFLKESLKNLKMNFNLIKRQKSSLYVQHRLSLSGSITFLLVWRPRWAELSLNHVKCDFVVMKVVHVYCMAACLQLFCAG